MGLWPFSKKEELPEVEPEVVHVEIPMDVVSSAKVCHEVNKALCEAAGDFSQASWEDALDWQKASAIQGVHFHMDNPEAGPEASHNNWSTDKYAEGWKYGKTKDADRKTHPCLREFNKLPLEQRAKDHIFKQIVTSLK